MRTYALAENKHDMMEHGYLSALWSSGLRQKVDHQAHEDLHEANMKQFLPFPSLYPQDWTIVLTWGLK